MQHFFFCHKFDQKEIDICFEVKLSDQYYPLLILLGSRVSQIPFREQKNRKKKRKDNHKKKQANKKGKRRKNRHNLDLHRIQRKNNGENPMLSQVNPVRNSSRTQMI